MILFLTILGSAPVITLILIIYNSNKIQRESPKLVFQIIGMGALCVIPAVIWEMIGEVIVNIIAGQGTVLNNFLNYFFVVALAEEVCKYVFMYIVTWKNRKFDCALDGILYTVCSSMGFALVENLLYIFLYSGGVANGVAVGFLRAFTAIPFHCIFAIFMGFFYGRAREAQYKHNIKKRNLNLFLCLFVPVMIHGFYDFTATYNGLFFIWFIFLIFMYVYTIVLFVKETKKNRKINGELTLGISEDGWFRYGITSKDEIIIMGLTRPVTSQELIIPQQIKGYPVVGLNTSAFAYTNIVNVWLPPTLKYVGDLAFFACPYLQKVILPSSVTRIGNYAFEYCSSLNYFVIPHVRIIGNQILEDCHNLSYVHYMGSQEEWSTINVNMYENTKLLNVNFYYNSNGGQPTY